MHPEVEKEEPGICPICGMDLEPKQVAEGMENSSYRDLLHRLYIGIALTVPLLAFSIFAEDKGFSLAAISVLYAGRSMGRMALLSESL